MHIVELSTAVEKSWYKSH